MRRRARLALLATIGMGAITLAPAVRSDDRGRAVSLIKMPYRGERNMADLSDSPEYLEKGGLPSLLEKEGWRLRSTQAVALTPEEQKAYGEWNRLGLANGNLARIVAAEVKAGGFPVGLLANCSALMGMLGGLQHAGPTSRPLRVGLVFIDAHGDFNTPETTLSGMLGGMPVAISAGLGLTRLRLKSGLDPALPERHIVLAAVRDLIPWSRPARPVGGREPFRRGHQDPVREHRRPDEEALEPTDLIYVHVDMDVLDPTEVAGHPLTVPGGPTSLELAAAVTEMFGHEKAAAFGVASTPSGDQDADGSRARPPTT